MKSQQLQSRKSKSCCIKQPEVYLTKTDNVKSLQVQTCILVTNS